MHGRLQTFPRHTSFCGDFSKKQFIANSPESLEDLKHGIKQTVANNGTETFGNTVQSLLKYVDALIKSRAVSRVNKLKLADVSGTISVPILRASEVTTSANHPKYMIPLGPCFVSGASLFRRPEDGDRDRP
jgi:hypothetical protein